MGSIRESVVKATDNGMGTFTEVVHFWGRPEEWPGRHDDELAFLADAVHEIGEAHFAEWTFDEPIARRPNALDPASKHSPARAKRILTAIHGPSFVWRPDAVAEQIAEANATIGKVAAEAVPKIERFNTVVGMIAAAAGGGKKLITGTRDLLGGSLRRLDPYVWKTEGQPLRYRFQYCQIDREDAFGKRYGGFPPSQPKGRSHQLLFITRDSLEPYKAELRALRVAARATAVAPMSPKELAERIQRTEVAQEPDEAEPQVGEKQGPGRKRGSVKNPDELKIRDVLVQRFRADPEMTGLPGRLIDDAAIEADVSTPSEAMALDAFQKRIRRHLKKYSDIAPRISRAN